MGKMLFMAFALMLIVEGLLPFIGPRIWREMFTRVISMTDGQIRFIGLTSMISGLILLLFAK
jgi:uncharacterized protein YjeT (DUF2065 family)